MEIAMKNKFNNWINIWKTSPMWHSPILVTYDSKLFWVIRKLINFTNNAWHISYKINKILKTNIHNFILLINCRIQHQSTNIFFNLATFFCKKTSNLIEICNTTRKQYTTQKWTPACINRRICGDVISKTLELFVKI